MATMRAYKAATLPDSKDMKQGFIISGCNVTLARGWGGKFARMFWQLL